MEQNFETTTYKIRELWDIVTKLAGQIEVMQQTLKTLDPRFATIFDRVNTPIQTPTQNIDVQATYLVQLDSSGNPVKDENGNVKKSALLRLDSTKSVVVWDKDAQCWRFYAVYADGV